MDPSHWLSPCRTATAALIQLLLVFRPFKQILPLSEGLQFPGSTPCVREGFTPRGKDREDGVSKRGRKVPTIENHGTRMGKGKSDLSIM